MKIFELIFGITVFIILVSTFIKVNNAYKHNPDQITIDLTKGEVCFYGNSKIYDILGKETINKEWICDSIFKFNIK